MFEKAQYFKIIYSFNIGTFEMRRISLNIFQNFKNIIRNKNKIIFLQSNFSKLKKKNEKIQKVAWVC